LSPKNKFLSNRNYQPSRKGTGRRHRHYLLWQISWVHKKNRQDKEGLGRWSWILLGGMNGRNTCMITVYNPCKDNNVNLGMTYQQQCRYFIMKKKDLTCPFNLFCKHLVKQIKQWQAEGDRIILFMDHNKHVINGALVRALVDKE
jgi:hypothetical protein